MQRDQNTHVLWQIRACAVSAVHVALLGLLSAQGRHWQHQTHSVSVSGAKAHPWQFWAQSGLCLALRGNSTVQPGNKCMFYPVTVHLCQMLSVEYVSGSMSRFCPEDLLWSGSAAGTSVLML